MNTATIFAATARPAVDVCTTGVCAHAVVGATAARSATTLEQAIVDSLGRYHNTDGKGNGSKQAGIQLAPGITSRAQLETELARLAAFLARQPDVVYKAAPKDDPERAAARRVIAHQGASLAATSRMKLMTMVSRIGDAALRNLVQKAIGDAPRDFFTAPSSSSGKFHPADEINHGGLVLHTARVARMAELLADYYRVTPELRDALIAGAIVHDMQKGGMPWKGYAADHGHLAAQWLGDTWGTRQHASRELVRELAANHMAQWNKPAPTPPTTLAHQLMSYADYLAALDDVYVRV